MEKLELERKWLVLDEFKIPEDVEVTKVDITQMYLVSDKKERLRISQIGGERKITHTIKIPADGGGNWETERELTDEEYCQMILRVDKECYIILKRRNVFWMDGIKYELDVFAHPIKIVILEVEIDSLDQKVNLPSWLGRLVEVTNVKEFSNKRIASKPDVTLRKVEEIRSFKY